MGYVLLLGVWIFPQCNYDMLILPPFALPMTETRLPNCLDVTDLGEERCE